MKARPRQIDQNKAFSCIDSHEKFNQAEGQGQDLDQIAPQPIVTPDMLQAAASQTKYTSTQPKKQELPTEKIYHYPSADYLRYMAPVYPAADTYELTDADLQFLSNFNSKLKTQGVMNKVHMTTYHQDGQPVRVEIEDFERFLAFVDLRSGKHVIIEFQEFQEYVNATQDQSLSKSVRELDKPLLQELFQHWKKDRLDLNRTLVRRIMYPDIQETDPHLAFRSRLSQNDRTMKLRRGGNNQQQKGLQEYDLMSLRVCSLKDEFNRAQYLLKDLLLREQAVEIDRRLEFAIWERTYQQALSGQNVALEMKKFSMACCLNDRKAESHEEKFDMLAQEQVSWKRGFERAQHEMITMDQAQRSMEARFKAISQQHRHYTDQVVEESVANNRVAQRQERESARERNYENKEFLEERNVTMAKFLSTCYLGARPLNLTFERVMNETMTLSNFTPMPQRNHTSVVYPPSNPAEVAQPTALVTQIPRRSQLIHFIPMKLKRSNFIYRLHPNNEFVQLDMDLKKQHTTSSTLQNKHSLFAERARRIVENTNDYGLNEVDDDRYEEEELKQARKKLKLNLTKNGQPIK